MNRAALETWTVGGKGGCTIVNWNGESIANGGNNRAVQGEHLADCLQLAATAPQLFRALVAIMDRHDELGVSDLWLVEAKAARAAIAAATRRPT